MAIFFCIAIVSGLALQFYAAAATQPLEKEHFMQKEKGMPLDMEAAQGPIGVAGFSGVPPLLGSEPKPVPDRPYDMADDNKLFQFSGNRISSDCCPSPFTSDKGCVCLTDKQVSEFSSRGGNRGME